MLTTYGARDEVTTFVNKARPLLSTVILWSRSAKTTVVSNSYHTLLKYWRELWIGGWNNAPIFMKISLGLCQVGAKQMRFSYWNRQLRNTERGIRITFIDLEKAYDSIPREDIWRSSREQHVPEKYTRLVQDMYQGCKTVVRSAAGESNSFGVEVGLHQGSALSPYLFLLLMDVLTEDVRKDVPGQWCLQMTLHYAVMTRQTRQSTWRPGGMH